MCITWRLTQTRMAASAYHIKHLTDTARSHPRRSPSFMFDVFALPRHASKRGPVLPATSFNKPGFDPAKLEPPPARHGIPPQTRCQNSVGTRETVAGATRQCRVVNLPI